MAKEWRYFEWVIPNFCSITESSTSLCFQNRQHTTTMKLVPSTDLTSMDDLFQISISSKSLLLKTSTSDCELKTFIRDLNDEVRFVQCTQLTYLKGDYQNDTFGYGMGYKYSLEQKIVWKMQRKVILENRKTLEDKNKQITFIFRFGPVSSSIKEGSRVSVLSEGSVSCSQLIFDGFMSLSSDLGKFIETGSLSDIALHCDGETFNAHKIILSARSEVFNAMFMHDMSENRSGVVDIKYIGSSTFKDFLRYLYTTELPIFDEVSSPLLYDVAEKYGVGALKKACSIHMTNNLKVDNVCEIVALAHSHSDEEFKKSGIEFIKREKDGVLHHNSWLKFIQDYPILALETYNFLFIK